MVKVEIVMDEKEIHSRHMLNFKLVKLSWALFFILIGVSFLIDNSQKWAIIYAGSGAILLLLNLLRIVWKINVSKFTIWLGAVGLLFGVAALYNLDISIWSAAILLIGIIMLFEVIKK
ncbi:MAG: hypothetical protein OIN87_04690 [Candidatus Methanoperedens sp.]|nr:hypothetical protein [Candidatus Methanoperedens sp.]